MPSDGCSSAISPQTSVETEVIPMDRPTTIIVRHRTKEGEALHIIHPESVIQVKGRQVSIGGQIDPMLARFGFGGKLKDVVATEVRYRVEEIYTGTPPSDLEREEFKKADSRAYLQHTGSSLPNESFTVTESRSIAVADRVTLTDSVKVLKYDKNGNFIGES